MKYIVLMGPVSPPYTGQSVAFTTIVNAITKDKIVINISCKNNISMGIMLCFKIMVKVLFEKIDVIYFTCSRSFLGSIRDVVLLLCARMKKIRVINHLHGNTFYRFYHAIPFWYQPIVKYAYNWVDTSIVLLPSMKEQFRDFPSMKIATISNCYSSDMDNIPLKKTKTDSTIKLLYLSNIMESKGITFLLEACDELLEMYPNLSLCIAGAFIADEFSSLEKITQRFYKLYTLLKQKYPTQIDYKGIAYGETKIELLWNSDIFILPTFYPVEAFPISILEAMRMGNYIISTNHNLLPEIVNYNNGILIEPQSSEAIINAVSDIYSDKKRLKEVQYFNMEYAIQNYQECKYLDSVLSLIKTK